MRITSFIVLVLALLSGACASTPGGAQRSALRSSNSDRITLEELEASNLPTAYDLVQQLRPQWLHARSWADQVNPVIAVYVNGSRYGTVDDLRQISRQVIGSMEFLNNQRVRTEFSANAAEGVKAAIMISTRKVGDGEQEDPR